MGRDERGRFVKGNQISRQGGFARGKIDPAVLSRIGRAGWDGFVAARFGGDYKAARTYMYRFFGWIGDKPYWGTPFQKWTRPELPARVEQEAAA